MSNKLIDINDLSTYKTNADAKYQDKLITGDGISLNNNVASAGATYADLIYDGSVSVANATTITVKSATFEPGNYILVFSCQYSSNSSGYRRCFIAPSGGTIINDHRKAVNGTLTTTRLLIMFQVSATEYPNGRSYDFRIRQNSGKTLTAYPRGYYIKF